MADTLGETGNSEDGAAATAGEAMRAPPGPEDARAARARISGHVAETPFLHSRTLSSIAGCDLLLKFENLQFTASFKERGALNKLLLLRDDERRRGVIAVSAGNHAQGVAYHATRLGIPSVIVMPRFAPFVKIDNTERLGAEVVLAGETFAEARARMQQLADERGMTIVHPYDDAAIVAGQATLGLEMLEAEPELDRPGGADRRRRADRRNRDGGAPPQALDRDHGRAGRALSSRLVRDVQPAALGAGRHVDDRRGDRR